MSAGSTNRPNTGHVVLVAVAVHRRVADEGFDYYY